LTRSLSRLILVDKGMKPATNARKGDRMRNGRAILPVYGAFLLGLMAFVWLAQGPDSGNWPTHAWALFWALIATGLLSICAGIQQPHNPTVQIAGANRFRSRKHNTIDGCLRSQTFTLL
jgi:hypothetical protein